MQRSNQLSCGLCGFRGSDVKLLGCGCTLHARCVPLEMMATRKNGMSTSALLAVPPNSVGCPCCKSQTVEAMYLFPIMLEDLDRAVQIRKTTASGTAGCAAAGSGAMNENGKRAQGSSAVVTNFLDVQAEASYLLLSHSHAASSSLSLGGDYQRTGRWTEEETAFVDYLLEAFDKGQLPLPEGMRLNDFLRDVLLCKSSRLTKKMKNAKLSSRCYTILGEAVPAAAGARGLDLHLLSSLEDQFLKSVTSEASRLELSFNLTRVWRTLLSNLCLQIGSSLLRVDDWISSLENVEHRAVEAEEAIRKARRQRMGMALKTDSRNTQTGVFFSGVPVGGVSSYRPTAVRTEVNKKQKVGVQAGAFAAVPSAPASAQHQIVDSSSSVASDACSDHSQFVSQMLDLAGTTGGGGDHKIRDSYDDFSSILSELAEDAAPVGNTTFASNLGNQTTQNIRSHCGPFLDAIAALMESAQLPFDHADVWVPSFDPMAGGASLPEKSLRLYHAGYVTRHDLDPQTYCHLNEYGEYSTRFSFASGVGLPGRVYATGQHVWERHIDEADPKFFERAGGAKVYGIKTGFGLALSTNVIGRMVITLYSKQDLAEDARVVQICQAELEKYSPEPKWKLVIDMAPSPKVQPASPNHLGTGAVDHLDFGSSNVASSLAAAGATLSGTSSGTVTPSSILPHEEEQRIAVMLGDHIPLAELPESGSRPVPMDLVPLFMSLRLLLLRSPSRRSEAENEVIEVIRKSYRGYSHDGRRTDKEIAFLLVKDWQYLGVTLTEGEKKPAAVAPKQQEDAYKCHVMNAPSHGSFSSTGAPPRMPSLPDILKVRSASLDSMPEGTISRNVNIVHHSD